MVLSACVPTMLYCALRAPHHTPRAQALTFAVTAAANMLPPNHAEHNDPPCHHTCALTGHGMGLLTTIVTLWLGYIWLKEALAGWRYAPFSYCKTQQ